MLRHRLIIAAFCVCSLAWSARAEAVVRLVATIFPIADLVQQIGGDAVEVVTLLPPGASPHTFEPTPAQMRDVAQARVFVRVGAGLDTWTEKLLAARNPNLAVLTLTDGVRLLSLTGEHADEHAVAGGRGGDPHIWLDPVLVRDQVVPAISTALTQAAPDQHERFETGAAALREALTRLDADTRAALAPLSNRNYIGFHAAWRYFGARYGLHQVAVVEAFPGKEPSARDIAAVVETARAAHVRMILIEPQMNPRVAEQIARDCGAQTRVVDELGAPNLPGRNHYIDLMRYNVQVFVEALQ
jgi:zinc transport system substrate-binding protein